MVASCCFLLLAEASVDVSVSQLVIRHFCLYWLQLLLLIPDLLHLTSSCSLDCVMLHGSFLVRLCVGDFKYMLILL